MNCEQRRERMLDYLMDLLEPSESEEMRAHLSSGCPQCSGALAEAEAMLALLAASVKPVTAPGSARDRLIKRLERGRAPASNLTIMPAPSRWFPYAVAAGLAILVVGGPLWYLAQEREQQLRQVRTALANRDADMQQLRGMLGSAQLQLIMLADPRPKEKAFGRVFWDRDRGQWHVFVFDLQPPGPGKTYELWFITPDGRKIAAGVFDVDSNGKGAITVVVPNVGPIKLAAITDEPAGGATQPTGAIRLAGEVE